MTKPQHTPGPWEVSPNWPFPDEQGRRFDAVVKKAGGSISLVCSFEHSVFRTDQNYNARLIAAAPDLLEALEDIAFNLENSPMSNEQEKAFRSNPFAESWRVYLSSLIITARNQAKLAIAKANGGSNA